MKTRTKKTILSMVRALERFEKCQLTYLIDEDDWTELNVLISEKNVPVTWNEIGQFKEGLKSMLAETVNQDDQNK